jgi:tetratricopeptide (TPR) repeat protein
LKFWFIVACAVLQGCASQVSDKTSTLLETVDWLGLIKHDSDTLSEYQMKVASALGDGALFEQALDVCSEIENFRRPLAFSDVGKIALKAGQPEYANKALADGKHALAYGVGWQRDEGLSSWCELALALGHENLVEKSIPEIDSPACRQRIKDQLTFSQSKGGQIKTSADQRFKEMLHEVEKGKSTAGFNSYTPKNLLEEFLKAAELACQEGRNQDAKNWLQIARGMLSQISFPDRIGFQIRLCRLDQQLGNLDAAVQGCAQAKQELGMVGAGNTFKYPWLFELAGVYQKLGMTKEVEVLLNEASLKTADSVPPFFQTGIFSQLAAVAYKSNMVEESNRWWEKCLVLIEANPNPRSKAVGSIDYLLSHAQVGLKPNNESQRRLNKIKQSLPMAYSKLPGF